MKHLHFSYTMELQFDAPVSEHRFTLKCIPVSNQRQKVICSDIQVFPNEFLCTNQDSFGNNCIFGYAKNQHDHFYVCVNGEAKTGLAPYETEASEAKLGIYRYPSNFTKPGEAIREYFSRFSFEPAASAFEKSVVLMEGLHQDFIYKHGVTSVSTTAEEALALGQGVCQDFSHIMISLCRLAGIPARYVVGMLSGEGLSHAWVEVCQEGRWIGLDPTNNLLVKEQHIKISHGRDYKDCMINQGVFTGLAGQVQTIRVLVEEKENDTDNRIGGITGG